MELRDVIEDLNKCEALSNRLINLKRIEDNPYTTYPFELVMMGFPALKVFSKEELLGRIKELEDLMSVKLKRI